MSDEELARTRAIEIWEYEEAPEVLWYLSPVKSPIEYIIWVPPGCKLPEFATPYFCHAVELEDGTEVLYVP